MLIKVLSFASLIISFIGLVMAFLDVPRMNRKRKLALSITIIFAMVLTSYIYLQGTRRVYGQFEWQWVGEGWIGTVSIRKNDQGNDVAELSMKQLVNVNGKYTAKPVLVSTDEGRIEGDSDGFRLESRVRKNIYENGEEKVMLQTLKADLVKVEAYAGTVRYESSEGKMQDGDIVLVRYKSGVSLY